MNKEDIKKIDEYNYLKIAKILEDKGIDDIILKLTYIYKKEISK
jgi:hypothetical protein